MSFTPSQQATIEQGSFGRLCVTIQSSCYNGVYTPNKTVFVQESPFGNSVTIPWSWSTSKSTSLETTRPNLDPSQTVPVQVTPHTSYILIPGKIELNPTSPFDQLT